MNKIISNKKIFSASLVISGIALFCATPVLAGNLGPLFEEANFLPGEAVTRQVEVTNTSGGPATMGLRIVDNSSCSGTCLSDVLYLVVSENGNVLHEGSLTSFYGAGEQVLSDLGTDEITTYDFSITFNSGAENDYQEKTANFDIHIGFFGEATPPEQQTTVSGGGNRIGDAGMGLRIFDERTSDVNLSETTITWKTNHESTSRVVYSPEGSPHSLDLGNPPKYGYAFSTDEDFNKVINHEVTIAGLLPGTTYYFRCISRGSFAFSTEFKFTTRSGGVTTGEGEEGGGESGPGGGGTGEGEEGGGEGEEGGPSEISGGIETGEEGEGTGLSRLLAAAGSLFKLENLWWFLIILLIIIIILLLLSRKRKKKKEE
jgi:hypothetical protein